MTERVGGNETEPLQHEELQDEGMGTLDAVAEEPCRNAVEVAIDFMEEYAAVFEELAK